MGGKEHEVKELETIGGSDGEVDLVCKCGWKYSSAGKGFTKSIINRHEKRNEIE